MHNPEHIHLATEEMREDVLQHLGRIIAGAVQDDMVAYPHIIGQGPTPLLGGVAHGGEPRSLHGLPLRVRVFHRGTPSGSGYRLELIEGEYHQSADMLVQIDAAKGLQAFFGRNEYPLRPKGYAKLGLLLQHTIFSEEETYRAMTDLTLAGQLCKPEKPSFKELLYTGFLHALTAMHPKLSGLTELTYDKEQERRPHDSDE